MDLREIGWDDVDWIDMAQDRDQWRAFVSTILNLRVPWNAGKFLSDCPINGSSRRAQLREYVSKYCLRCRSWGSHSGGYEVYCLLAYNVV
jgi:hypothetical protein